MNINIYQMHDLPLHVKVGQPSDTFIKLVPFISNQKLFIHTYKQVHSVYKSKVFKSIYIYTNTTIVGIMHSIYI